VLATLVEVLQDAKRKGYAVPHFDVCNLESTQAVIRGAEKARSPVIVAISEKTLQYGDEEAIVELVRAYAQRSKIPTVVHLDHGHTPALVERALSWGFTSVQIDVSGMRSERGVKIVSDLVYKAQAKGISVEAEIDAMPHISERSKGLKMTNPQIAARFVAQTRIDAFAVVIGNVHGGQAKGEKLDLKLLEKINAAITAPLVLHGASGLPKAQLIGAIKRGVVKINIDTELRVATTTAIRKMLKDKNIIDPRDYLAEAREAMAQVVVEMATIFGSRGKSG